MSRYTGPTYKKSRRYNFSILETEKEFSKGKQRQYAPGQHGKRRQKISDYGLHLYEKQKVRYMYGLNEKQFKNTFLKATKSGQVAGTSFLQMLESRLDNIVFRIGFSETRRQSRQLVNHGHILVNKKKVDIPSYIVSIGDTISIKEKFRTNKQLIETLNNHSCAPWIKYDKSSFSGKYERLPERNELSKKINEGLIVEYYNK